MSTLQAARERQLPKLLVGDASASWWAMWLVLATETSLFAALLFSYFYLALGTSPWPPTGIKLPELALPAIGTSLLLSSTLPMAWAQISIRRGQQAGLLVGLMVSFAMGALFLGLQLVELAAKDFQPQTNAYGSVLFTIVGLHGVHVVVGLLISAVVQLRAWLGHFSARRHSAIENLALYWYFLALLSTVIFILLDVSPHVSQG